jgi:hypothetical protein
METMLEAIESVRRVDAGNFDLGTRHLAHLLLEEAGQAFKRRVLEIAAYQQLEDEFLIFRTRPKGV